VTANKREYQLAYMLEKSTGFWESWKRRGLTYESPDVPDIIPKTYASSIYDPSLLNPIIWLDGNDIDGDGDTGDNPADGASVTTWVNKGTLGASGNATRTTGTVSYEDGSVNGDA